MATTKVALGALLGALAAVAPGQGGRARHVDDRASVTTSALVLRVSAPLPVHPTHGDASIRAHLGGSTWRVAVAWSSERGRVELGAVIADQPDA
jgi:hypothetical protein